MLYISYTSNIYLLCNAKLVEELRMLIFFYIGPTEYTLLLWN